MATRSLRHRSSRYSSPATFGEKEPAPKPVEEPPARNGQQTSLDNWIEPAIRPPAPSFEDSKGLERVGVLENMQPLGTAPTQRLLQKLKLNYTRPSPRPTPVRAVEEAVTPVAEPAEKMDLVSPAEEAVSEQPERFPDIPPRYQPPPDTILISSPPRGRPPRRETTDMSLSASVSQSPVTYPLAPPHHVSPKPLSIQQQLRQDRLRIHVERAIQEAQQKNSPDLVNGLRQIREDAQFNPDLWNVVEAMINNFPSPEQFKLFKRYIKKGVKRHRRESQMSGSPYQSSPQRFKDLTSPLHRERSPKASHAHTPATSHSEEPRRRINLYFTLPRATENTANEEMPVSPSTVPPPSRLTESGDKSTRLSITVSPQKRKRSGSESSSSSLSSAPSIPEGVAPPWETGNGRTGSAGQRQATGRGTAGHRLRSAVSSQPAPTPPQPEVAGSSSKTNASKRFKKTRDEPDFDIDELTRRKRHYLDDSFHDYNTIPRPESNERDLVHGHPDRPVSSDHPPPPVIHPNRLIVSLNALVSPVSSQMPSDSLPINGTSRKRVYDEIDADDMDISTPDTSSPGPFLAPPPPPPGVRASSRAATPRASRVQPAPKTRKSARVMVSPNKPKNGGITAGISRAGAGRDAPAAIGSLNSADSGAEDNDEFCASCGGEGKLLCCDGCTNSFHHACLEPPLNPDEEVEGEWFCPRCVARRTRDAVYPTGLLGLVLRRVDDVIPKAYSLPHDIREYFEGVRTGDEGEYEEVGLPRTQNNVGRMNRAGFIEEPNYKETRDSKGNIIRCYYCKQTSGGRDIIPCDFCPAKWHLDCIDPPLAVPPRRRAGDKPGASWRCPLHIDHDLVAVSRQAEKAPGALGRIPRPRKPKHAIPLDVPTARGFRNNGVIEVELMKDQPELDKTKEVQMHGKVYRIPEMAIRLDFIDRVKKSWYEDQSFPRLMDAPKKIRSKRYRPDRAVLHHPPQQTIVKIREPEFFTGANALAITETAKANAALRNRSIREQQAVLHLADMSQRGINGYSGDSLAELTNQLISEAPDNVVRLTEQTEMDRLLQLQQLINNRLAVLNHGDTPLPAAPTSSNGHVNGDQLTPAQDPNIDPVLQGGGYDVLSPVRDQGVPIDPALQMSPVNETKPKLMNGDRTDDDDGSGQDADDERTGWNSTREISQAPVDESAPKGATQKPSHERDSVWLDNLVYPANTSAASTNVRYGSSPDHHPLSRFGNENGNGMEMGS